MNVANVLSAARLALAVPIAAAVVAERPTAAIVLGLVALLTDLVDGPIARRQGGGTELGRILDPLADKALVACIGFALFWTGRVPLEFFAVVVGRDVVLLAFGWLKWRKAGFVPSAEWPGKIAFAVLGVYLAGEVAGIRWPDRAPAVVGALYVLGAVTYLRHVPALATGRGAKGER